jgi:hypothetical protein
MLKTIELDNSYFGDNLLYGHIDTYGGALSPEYYDFEAYVSDSEIDTYNEDDYDFNFDVYMERVNENLRTWFEDTVFKQIFQPLGFTRLIYTKLNRPREYNFYSDSVSFSLEYDTNTFGDDFAAWAVKRIKNLGKIPTFNNYLKEHFSSYDGFRSLTPNNTDELKTQLKDKSYDYRAINAFVAAWVATEIENGNCKGITKSDFEDVVENIQRYECEFWYKKNNKE